MKTLNEYFKQDAREWIRRETVARNSQLPDDLSKSLTVEAARGAGWDIHLLFGGDVETCSFNDENWRKMLKFADENGIKIPVLTDAQSDLWDAERSAKEKAEMAQHDKEVVDPAFDLALAKMGGSVIVLDENGLKSTPALHIGDVVKIKAGSTMAGIGIVSKANDGSYAVEPIKGMPRSHKHAWYHITEFEKVILGPLHLFKS